MMLWRKLREENEIAE